MGWIGGSDLELPSGGGRHAEGTGWAFVLYD